MTTAGFPQTIGAYRIDREIGRGGMGIVYLAHDTKLDRDVAIKVLPDELLTDAARLARFEREAKLLATLHHTNIAAVYGLEEVEGKRYLALEYVPGETLGQVLDRGPIPVGEALPVAVQIAEAVEAAHSSGIIHRDLKPDNVKVSGDGTVKVLDFGLAKALDERATNESKLADSPTIGIQHSPTIPGAMLGTAGYMSPEQVRGQTIDRRSDIWSFGCLLYEMLTGEQVFGGESVSDSIGATLHKQPEWDKLPPDTPAMVQLLLRRCLARDRKRRLHDIADVRVELEEAIADPTASSLSLSSAAFAATRGPSRRWLRALPWVVVAGTVLTSGIVIAMLRSSPGIAASLVARFTVAPPGGERLAVTDVPAVSLSPDGERIAFVGTLDGRSVLYVRGIDSLEASALPGTEGAQGPFFSSDGEWLGFFTGGELKKVSLAAGRPTTLSSLRGLPRGASWWDDTIVFSPGTEVPLMSMSASGGASRPLTELREGERTHRWPQVLPGGKVVLFTVGAIDSPESYDDSTIEAKLLDTGERRVIYEGAAMARYLPGGPSAADGFLLCARNGTLLAVPFDAASLRVTGSPVPVVNEVLSFRSSGGHNYSVSETGDLAYIPGVDIRQDDLVTLDRQGRAEALSAPSGIYYHPSLSPDGRSLAAGLEGERTIDIWIHDVERRTMRRFTFEGNNFSPVWTPDGASLVFASARDGGTMDIYMKSADGSGADELLVANDLQVTPDSFTPDGRVLAYSHLTAANNSDIYVYSMDEGTIEPLITTHASEGHAQFSPDGRWLAYASNESGQIEVYVKAYPGPGGTWQVSRGGGDEPRWAPNGSALLYRNGNRLMEAQIDTRQGFEITATALLHEAHNAPRPGYSFTYAPHPDGERIYTKRIDDRSSNPERLHVVLGWSQELRRRLAVGGDLR